MKVSISTTFVYLMLLLLMNSCSEPKVGDIYIATIDTEGYSSIESMDRMEDAIKSKNQNEVAEMIYGQDNVSMIYIGNKVRILDGGAKTSLVMVLDSVSSGKELYVRTKDFSKQ